MINITSCLLLIGILESVNEIDIIQVCVFMSHICSLICEHMVLICLFEFTFKISLSRARSLFIVSYVLQLV